MSSRFDNGICQTCGLYARDKNMREIHNAWHNSMGQTLDPPAPPTPEWREMVDRRATVTYANALGTIFYSLYNIQTPGHSDVAPYLARIVAICEAEVGDDWQAAPSVLWARPGIDSLLEALSDKDTVIRWKKLGNCAAAWLRDLTEGGGEA